MTGANAIPEVETFTRLIDRLSIEIRQLIREIPLREGRLLEMEATPSADSGEAPRLAEELGMARQRLLEAELDLVAIERWVGANGQ
jgi:hypothetical protein